MKLYPNLMSSDVNASLTFYEKLGFEVIKKMPREGECHWAMIEQGETRLMFQSGSSLKGEFKELNEQSKGGALTLWIHVFNVASLFEKTTDDMTVLKPLGITEYNGANEFVLQDPNGFILHFSDFDLNTL